MNWITELGLNKDKQKLKNKNHHQGGKCSMICMLRKRALSGCRAHLGKSQRGIPSYSLLLIICRPSEVSRCVVHSMDNTGTTGAPPEQGYRGKSTLGCSGHASSVCRAALQETQTPAPPRFEWALVSHPGFVPSLCWAHQGYRRPQGHTAAPSPREKMNPSG